MRRLSGLGLVWTALLLAACSSSGPPPPASQIPDAEQAFVVDPLVGYARAADPVHADAVRTAFAGFARGVEPLAVATTARGLLDSVPDFLPATVLLAQTDFLEGRFRATIDGLTPILDAAPDYTAAALLTGRSYEGLGEIAAAFEIYRRSAVASTPAADRAAALRERAWEIVTRRFEEALDRGRLDDARVHLDRLASWSTAPTGESADDEPWPAEQIALLDAEHRLSAAGGDRVAELEILNQLETVAPSAERRWRLGELELEVGDVRAGLAVFERLAAERPAELGETRLIELPDRLAAAQFLFKIELLPPEVSRTSRRAELERSDLATLLYWLLPGVRFAEIEDAPIAADILDHPMRREILVILDQALMGIDRSRHRFRPGQPATRQVALAAILTFLQSGTGSTPACLEGEPTRAADARPRPWVCATAARCGLLADPLDCLPAARLSGREALELVRHGLEALETSAQP
ncbi:MAG: hypothetical protein AAGE94_01545 [Acidobacteriota bacterium]